MRVPRIAGPPAQAPLRLWPGTVAAALLVLVRFVLPATGVVSGGAGILSAFAGAVAILVWWLLLSRAYWVDRLAAIVVMAAAMSLTSPLVHASIANGMMGNMVLILAVPLMSLALVGSVAGSRQLAARPRRATIAWPFWWLPGR